jgi:hypothetical protein
LQSLCHQPKIRLRIALGIADFARRLSPLPRDFVAKPTTNPLSNP